MNSQNLAETSSFKVQGCRVIMFMFSLYRPLAGKFLMEGGSGRIEGPRPGGPGGMEFGLRV